MQQGQKQLKVELTLSSTTMPSIEVIDQELRLEKRLMDTLNSGSSSHSNGQSIHLHYSEQQTWGESSDDFETIAAAAAVSEAVTYVAGAAAVVVAAAAVAAAAGVAAVAAAAGVAAVAAAVGVAAAGIVAASGADGVGAAAAEFAAVAAAGTWLVQMGLQLT